MGCRRILLGKARARLRDSYVVYGAFHLQSRVDNQAAELEESQCVKVLIRYEFWIGLISDSTRL